MRDESTSGHGRAHEASDPTWHARPVTTSDAVPAAPTGAPRGGLGQRVRNGLARVGIRSELGRDTVLAVAWAVVTIGLLGVLVAYGEFYGATRVVPSEQIVATCVLAVVQCLPLALRRRAPVTTLLAVVVLQALILAVAPRGVALWTAAPIVAAYTVGLLLPARRTVGIVLGALVVTIVGALAGTAGSARAFFPGVPENQLAPGGVVVEALTLVASGVLILGVSAAVGSWVALRRAHDRDVRARSAEALEHQATRTRAAVAAERTRMARELHDVAAHHLTGLVVQAGAAERLVDVDPERAKESLRSVRAQGRETLDALRSIVGILRETGEGATGTVPVPGLADVPGLLDAARASGTEVERRDDGAAVPLAPLADVTAYRTVQEALANARRHAPGLPVTLTTSTTPDRLRLEVEHVLPPARDASHEPGYGLVGMRERAALVGGHLEAGPTAEGTWRVRLDLPLERSESEGADA